MGEMRADNGTRKMVASILSLALVFAAEVVGVVVGMIFDWDLDLSTTVFGAIAAVLVVYALGGKDCLRLDGKAILEAFKFMWWIILISLVLMVWDLYDYIAAGEAIQPGWLISVFNSLVLCLAIGANEEGMFRGALFGGLLARFGGSKKGIWWAVIISSLAFGCAHVTLDDLDFNNWLTIVQALLKIVQTGIYAVMLCAVVLKTHNLVGPMLVHAFDDWLLYVVSSGLYGETYDTVYVVSDTDQAIETIIFYLIIIGLYFPTFIKAIRTINKIAAPQRGPLVSERELQGAPAAGYLGDAGYAGYATYPAQMQVPGGMASYPQAPPVPIGQGAQGYGQQGYGQLAYGQQQSWQPGPWQPTGYSEQPVQQMMAFQQPSQPQATQSQVAYYPLPTPASPLMPDNTVDDAGYSQLPQHPQAQVMPQQTTFQAQGIPQQVVSETQGMSQQAVQQQPQAQQQIYPQDMVPQSYQPQMYPQSRYGTDSNSSGRPPAPNGYV